MNTLRAVWHHKIFARLDFSFVEARGEPRTAHVVRYRSSPRITPNARANAAMAGARPKLEQAEQPV